MLTHLSLCFTFHATQKVLVENVHNQYQFTAM